MQQGMKQGIDLAAVVSLGLGTAVGVSIFSAIAPATGVAGAGMLLSVLIAAVPMFVIAVIYAFMGSALPTSGASYEWPRRFLHPFVGFLVAWLRIVANVGALIVPALVLVRYLSMLVELPVKPTMLALFVLFFGINYVGVGLAARVQTVLMSVLVVAFLLYAALGLPSVKATNFAPLLGFGWQGVFAAVPLLMGLFFGLEAATEVGDEVKDGRRRIPLGLAISIGSAVVLYLLVGGVTLGVLGAPALAASDAPLLQAATEFLGPWGKPAIVAMAVIAIGKSLNAIVLVFTRSLFAMGRAGALPLALARIHPRWGTPHVAILVAFVACTAGLLLPMSLTFLFLAVNIPTLLKYGSTCLSAARLIDTRRDLYEAAGFRFGRTALRTWAYAGAFGALCLVVLGFETDWKPYALLGGWGVVGTLYYFLGRRGQKAGALAD